MKIVTCKGLKMIIFLQFPLIQSAKRRGVDTHVFAWECGDVGEKEADFFYSISTVEKEKTLEKFLAIGVDGIRSIASDLAMITVYYVAERMRLVGNSMACTEVSTNKHKMRKCFEVHGDSSPKSLCVRLAEELNGVPLNYPVIEKQTGGAAAVRFIFSQKDVEVLNILKKTHPQWLVEENIHDITSAKVTDSSARFGYFILKASSAEELMPYLPEMRA